MIAKEVQVTVVHYNQGILVMDTVDGRRIPLLPLILGIYHP